MGSKEAFLYGAVEEKNIDLQTTMLCLWSTLHC